jgi:N-acetylglucosamine kinase-like BadF-type ATPase
MIADDEGNIAGVGRGGPGNHEGVGYDGVKLALSTAVGQALKMAGLGPSDICGAGFGIAGYDWPSEKPDTLDAISVLGLTCPLEAVNDMVVGLIAGASNSWGVVIDAGTGTNARGRTLEGREGMITGLGGHFGEAGGAGDLVHAAQVACAHEWTKRGPATQLSREIIKMTGAKDLMDLLEGITLEKYHLSARDAPMVFRVAEAGDPVAVNIIAWLGRELAESTLAVIRQLEIQDQVFDVVMIGSLFKGGRLLIDPMVARVHEEAPGAQFIPLGAPPVTGGVMLGMQMAGRDATKVRDCLLENAKVAYQE